MRERESVILGSLLHDVGKVLNRVKGVREKHPIFSKNFVLENEFQEKIKNFVDIGVVSTVCQRHHEWGQLADEILVQKIEDSHLRALAYIVSRADNYSSSEREKGEKTGEDFRKTRLLSIFSKVDIGKEEPSEKYYDLKPLSPKNCFPIDKEKAEMNENAYSELIKGSASKESEFNKAIKSLKSENFIHFYNGLLSILEENFWCIPSDTRFENQDISLFDHLSTTSAIAACLYDYHKNNFDEEDIKNDNLEKFILVGGDLSGIQKFIFEIEQTNPKKLSKILRGRSFYLSLLTDCASLKILKNLNLPISCKIMNAGGRFIILAPNTQETEQILEQVTKEINIWFLKTFLGKLSLNIDYSVTLSGNDFKSEKFNEKLKILNQKLEIKKLNKFNDEYFKTNNENTDFKDAYDKLAEKGSCSFCGIYPSLEKENRCQICEDSNTIGEKLISENFIGFSFEDLQDNSLSILDINFAFIKEITESEKYYLIEKISDNKNEEEKNFGYIKIPIANYIPQPQNNEICLNHEHKEKSENQNCNSLCKYCKDICFLQNEEGEIERKNIAYSHLTFQCIATHSLKENKGSGVDHLAVLKADVDFLGLIFSLGLEDKEKEQYISISRFATLSRMLNYFFTACLKDLIENKFNKIYTVYTGGDDMFLIGPWEQTIEFAIAMQKKFKEFVAENPNITISAGMSLFKPHSQVKFATEIAEEYLEKSKTKGKNKLTIFSTTINWNDMQKLTTYKDFLNNEYQDESSKIKTAFLYRLLKYQEMFIKTLPKDEGGEGHIESLKFHSLMARDLRRNIEIKEEGQTKNQKVMDELYKLCAIGEEQKKDLMKNLKIPVFWTIYKNRGGK